MKMNTIIEGELNNLLSKNDIKDLDIHAIWDNTLEKDENYSHILGEDWRKLKELEKSKIKVEEKEFESEQLKRLEDKTRKDLNKSIKEISKSTNNKIDEYFLYLNEYVDTLINSKSIFGLIICGSTGKGKSFNVIKRLNDNGLRYEKDYVLLNTHCSPMELYEFFYKYSDNKIIILDDISNLWSEEIKCNILMACLWNPTNKRIVNWLTTSEKLKVPSQFEFKSKIILLTNHIPEHLETLKSRCFYYELNFNYADTVKLIYEIGKLQRIPLEVLDFIKDNSSEASNLNFRTLFKINEIYNTNMNNGWEKLANLELETDEDKVIFLQIIKDLQFKSVNEQICEFVRQSGRSRTQFFRFKKQLVPKYQSI